MRLTRARTFLVNSGPPNSSTAFQMAGTTSRWLLANKRTKEAEVAEKRYLGLPLPGRCSVARSTKPAAINSLSCSVTAVRVTL